MITISGNGSSSDGISNINTNSQVFFNESSSRSYAGGTWTTSENGGMSIIASSIMGLADISSYSGDVVNLVRGPDRQHMNSGSEGFGHELARLGVVLEAEDVAQLVSQWKKET